ncbi:MAG: hypothetical protein HYY67_07710 [Thaumarchaeota archaeon]|nr:hypothetical protein [Nitrososphaerota archaeon]
MTKQKQERLIQLCRMPEKKSPLYSMMTLPWCCILPVAISWFGVGSAFLATFLRPLTVPLLGASAILLGYSHYKVWVQGHRSSSQIFWLTISTILSLSLWSWSIIVMQVLF